MGCSLFGKSGGGCDCVRFRLRGADAYTTASGRPGRGHLLDRSVFGGASPRRGLLDGKCGVLRFCTSARCEMFVCDVCLCVWESERGENEASAQCCHPMCNRNGMLYALNIKFTRHKSILNMFSFTFLYIKSEYAFICA